MKSIILILVIAFSVITSANANAKVFFDTTYVLHNSGVKIVQKSFLIQRKLLNVSDVKIID